VRTRVGYAGGKQTHPTYRDLGDHTESIEIDFDTAVITYRELLDVFWQEHSGTRKAFSIQYAAFVFTHGAEQARIADASRDARHEALGQEITTQVRPAGTFWRAEDSHQKYRLRHRSQPMAALATQYRTDRVFVDSTAAARLNGLCGGCGESALVKQELRDLGLPDSVVAKLVD